MSEITLLTARSFAVSIEGHCVQNSSKPRQGPVAWYLCGEGVNKGLGVYFWGGQQKFKIYWKSCLIKTSPPPAGETVRGAVPPSIIPATVLEPPIAARVGTRAATSVVAPAGRVALLGFQGPTGICCPPVNPPPSW